MSETYMPNIYKTKKQTRKKKNVRCVVHAPVQRIYSQFIRSLDAHNGSNWLCFKAYKHIAKSVRKTKATASKKLYLKPFNGEKHDGKARPQHADVATISEAITNSMLTFTLFFARTWCHDDASKQ